ncbi:MAG: PIN domain-containing protein [Pseudonocardiaceae bacterium]
MVIPLVLASHEAHGHVTRVVGTRHVRISAHACLEAYSVLTRLPGDARLLPAHAAELLRERFGVPITIGDVRMSGLVDELAQLHIAGGAVYDALIAATAIGPEDTMVTRDMRAATTYQKLNVPVEIITIP